MKKKKLIFVGVGVTLLGLLFMNFVLSKVSEKVNLSFSNMEAMAQGESTTIEPDCIESGYVCIGKDKNGAVHTHIGLTQVKKE